ncbi:hypothetical protein N7492_002742 [Penicillium capsulatum]|uniref:Uncharacterized protein n=1 Tax=Penicillium capsulatum TaxID=69766 RepID=A0A9W9IKN9_9EURO|nr:hypothetical protein N7492_002742 [Penicillium capsulatum]KAJ6122662.1 hypothetical protein N7512_005127 [Penicillium capsulatum]
MFQSNPHRWYWAGLAGLVIALFAVLGLLELGPSSVSRSLYSPKTDNSLAPAYKITSGTSKLHLLAPASGQHFRLCRAVASSYALGYPAPVFNGWNKEGDMDANKTHLAKVHTVLAYLETLPSAADNDLVLMIDGYDVLFQIPPDVLIQRYFATTKAASARIASRFGVDTIEGLYGDDAPRQTILFGSEKTCYPPVDSRVGCWAVPEDIGIPKGAYGPSDGELHHNTPRWLNSGTIIGPARDMRRMFAATARRIQETYNPDEEFSDSDQKYMSDVWGEQEYVRTVKAHQHFFHGHTNPEDLIPDDGIKDKIIPAYDESKETEFHIGVDHRSALFQTRAGSDPVLDMLQYSETVPNQRTTAAPVKTSVDESPDFKQYMIELPTNLATSIGRVLADISHMVDRVPRVTELRLGTNLVTRNVYGMFHSTGGKDYGDELWAKLWFYPYLRPMLAAAIKGLKQGRPIAFLEGRRWIPAHTVPKNVTTTNDYRAVGAWADLDGVWLGWDELCGNFEKETFGDHA